MLVMVLIIEFFCLDLKKHHVYQYMVWHKINIEFQRTYLSAHEYIPVAPSLQVHVYWQPSSQEEPGVWIVPLYMQTSKMYNMNNYMVTSLGIIIAGLYLDEENGTVSYKSYQ